MNLGGRTALVTGASGGLGQAIARALARRGADLVLTARRTELIEALADETRGRAISCDLADRAALERLIEEAGPVDALVANAALPASGRINTFSVDEIDRAIDVNLRAPMVLARLMSDAMAERGGGHIVFVSSLSGKAGTAGSSVYSATKFGLRGFAQGLREDLRPRGVGVSTVFPGFIRDAGMFHDSGAKLPGYVGTKTPDDVANAVVSAIERDRSEIDVAPITLRLGTMLSGLAPEAVAIVQRKLGASEHRVAVRDRPAREALALVALRRCGSCAARGRRAGSSSSSSGRLRDRADRGQDLVGELRAVGLGRPASRRSGRHLVASRPPRARCAARSAPASATLSSSSACRSLGSTSGRSRARRSTAAGSRSGTTATVSTTLLGTMIESSPCANVV